MGQAKQRGSQANRIEQAKSVIEAMKSWTIRVTDAKLQAHTFAVQAKGDCYLSANTKLVAVDKAVCISTEELARRFCAAVLPTMRRRHGETVSLTVYSAITKEMPIDDALVIARIDQNNFVPNKRPLGL